MPTAKPLRKLDRMIVRRWEIRILLDVDRDSVIPAAAKDADGRPVQAFESLLVSYQPWHLTVASRLDWVVEWIPPCFTMADRRIPPLNWTNPDRELTAISTALSNAIVSGIPLADIQITTLIASIWVLLKLPQLGLVAIASARPPLQYIQYFCPSRCPTLLPDDEVTALWSFVARSTVARAIDRRGFGRRL